MAALSLGGIASKAADKEYKILTGEIPKLEADIERVLKKMNDLAVPIKSNPNDSRAWSLYSQEEEKYLALKKIYEDELRVLGAPKGRKLEHFNKEETKILEMVAHARKSVS
jgi:hypothetical protein